jgi:branched-subunit amino acid aminotransferase/4-amino-4-deoxychorismate lyase
MRRFSRSLSTVIGKPWKSLGFDFTPTRSMVRYSWKDGSWDEGALQPELSLTIHPLSNALHYGQAIFEGLKAFHCEDGKVRVFNSRANAARMHNGCMRLHMPLVPPETFDAAIDQYITDNADYVPPYGSGGALYLRPFLCAPDRDGGAPLSSGPRARRAACTARATLPTRRPRQARRAARRDVRCAALGTVPSSGLARRPSTPSACSARPWARTTRAGSRRSTRSSSRSLTAPRRVASATSRPRATTRPVREERDHASCPLVLLGPSQQRRAHTRTHTHAARRWASLADVRPAPLTLPVPCTALADVQPAAAAKEKGYPVCLYLDAKENAYVEEFSTSNFIGVTKDGAHSP